MPANYRVLGPDVLESLHDPRRDFAQDVLVGLSERPKRLPSKYFYDDAGSHYFREIMALPEYYPTAAETEILRAHARDIVAPLLDRPLNVVDLGAGDGVKTRILLDALQEAGADVVYVPIDISEGAMKTLTAAMAESLPDMRVEGLVCEYADGVHYVGRTGPERRNLVLFLGSNIGNFDRVRARAFLRRLWGSLRQDDHALMGFDLKKDIEVLLAAYNDKAGVTSAFNLNLLERMNRELDADFDLSRYRHFGTYNVFSGAMESYLVSLEPQIVEVGALSQRFAFDAWEPIHTEYSYKYLRSDVDLLAADTGFEIIARYEDSRAWFLDALLRVERGTESPRPRG